VAGPEGGTPVGPEGFAFNSKRYRDANRTLRGHARRDLGPATRSEFRVSDFEFPLKAVFGRGAVGIAMPSRRRRLATLRVLTERATDEPNEDGMDASTTPPDADRDAGRSRSAPSFCRPKPVAPRPFREESEEERFVSSPPARASGASRVSHTSVETPAMSRPPAAAPTSAFEPARPAARASWNSVRPIWDDAPLREEHDEGDEDALPAAPAWAAVARGVALLFGTLIVVDLFAPSSRFTGSLWWLDLRPLPESFATGFLGMCAALLIAFAARASLPKPIKFAAGASVLLLILIALKDATLYYGLLKRGDLHAGPPVAFSLHVAACLFAVLIAMRARAGATGPRDILLVLLGFNAALVSLPVAQIACVGPIDGRRSAAAAVVFAPRSFESADRFESRVRTAIELQKQGLVPTQIIAGATAEESHATAMRLAHESGIDANAVVSLAASDDATVFAKLKEMFPTTKGSEPVLLAVSDADHLPRLQIEARRAGVKLATVPATNAQPPSRTVLLRETVELWRRYFRR